MSLVRIQNVTKQFGTQVVLEGVSLDLHAGEVVGLVGANGSGKSTLFRLITGELAPDLGTVTRSKGVAIGYLPQEPGVDGQKTLHDEVVDVFAGLLALESKLHELSEQIAARHAGPELDDLLAQYDRVNARFVSAGGYTHERRLNEVLGGLGFRPADYELPISALSGGQKCRAALAKLLLSESSFLLLDEPTNHLDIDAVRWLEKFLAGHHGGAVIVSHDRYFLDRLVDRIVELERRRLFSYPGTYTNYVRAKHVRELTQQRQYEKDRAYIEKQRTFIAKHGYAQRAKEAKGRQKRLERRLAAGEFELEKPATRRQVKIEFAAAEQGAHTVLRVEQLCKCYDEKTLFTDLNLQVDAGQRLGMTGPNGTGKSTLLKIVLSQVPATDGKVEFDPRGTVGYYAQEAEELRSEATVLEEILEAAPELGQQRARSFLGRFLFTGDEVFKTIAQLSGGEQSRVRLARLMLARPDVLILDEPTNHLDIPAREALEETLTEFPGTIIVSSHDRYFLDRVAQRLLIIRPEHHALYNGNYSFYIEQVEQQQLAAKEAATKAARPSHHKRTIGQRTAAEPVSPFDRLSLSKLEALIMEHEERIAAVHARFADPVVYQDGNAVIRLRRELAMLREELAAAEDAWNRRADAL
ncbi:MAG: ABC-F family ATP-binding cassette domain-containing protein [Planctomycetes bacterium]|nr:ABC-F family ATP-binding cassette domain-containing protein [Planctomycetota bacterium]